MRNTLAAVLAAVVVLSSIAFFARADPADPTGGATRAYYIAADTVLWDFAPSGANGITQQPFTEEEKAFADVGPHQVGRRIKKAIYREYTDSTFTTLKPRPAEWQHLGIMGPLVRAVVGDTIRITFRNQTPLTLSMHPHGVIYDKDSEGAPYGDGTSGPDKADDGVPPGGTHVYVWPVPERAGPSAHEGSSSMWMYHSHTDEIRDVNTGLIGAMIVTRRGAARPDGSPNDVDREIVASLLEFDENHSWFVQENVQRFATRPTEVRFEKNPFGGMATIPDFGTFFKETINGFFFGNTPGLTMRVGERVRWYVMANTNFEFHSPHWHGNVVVANMMRTDVVGLLPMSMVVADMQPDNPGTWLFHCHVADHLRMGMQSTYVVQPAEQLARR
jgi:FtsP/CotA-like multicopper oxidase with cupredoxin domain